MTNKKGIVKQRMVGFPVGDINNVYLNGVNALGEFEAEIMEAIWTLGKNGMGTRATASGIYDFIARKRLLRAQAEETRVVPLTYASLVSTTPRLKTKARGL